MALASTVQASFLGGQWSQTAQGNIADPKYKISMNQCLNGVPSAPGAWVKRSGTQECGFTRNGAPGRLIQFDFEENAPYNMEFTDGYLRFWAGPLLATTNDSVAVLSISATNPAVATLAAPVTWVTGNSGFLTGLGTSVTTLQNRVLLLTKLTTTTFALTDPLSGAGIDGTVLGAFTAGTLNRVLEIQTSYTAGIWSTVRSVQAEEQTFLLNGQVAPQQLAVTVDPIGSVFASFALMPVTFLDGPYLDPITSSNINSSGTSGVVALTLTYQPYVATTAYEKGEFVLSSSIGYQSLQDANVGNTPVSSPTFWEVVGFGAAINSGQGFVASDAGRLFRLYSEPPLWVAGTTYGAKAVVSYNVTGLPGQSTYWTSLVNSNTGNVPGADIINWSLTPANAAVWSWGKILGLSTTGFISGSLFGSVPIGNMGPLVSLFDGNTNKIGTACAIGGGTAYGGQNYSGASAQTISQVVVWPSNNVGFNFSGNDMVTSLPTTINLYGSNTLPSFSENGTLLGTSGPFTNSFAPVTIQSTDTTDTWNYVWVEVVVEAGDSAVAQVQFYSASAAPGTAVSAEILGAVLPYESIRTWQLGVYSNTTSWPTCGTYSDGRVWFSGAIPNRIDACYANGISGDTINFAPTEGDGTVTAANGISYVFNAPDVNPVFWMEPDLQGVICGTKAGEWLVTAPTAGGISPLNISARRVTKIRCANMLPARTEHTIVFVQTHQRKLMEYFPDVFSGKFTAPDLSEKWKNLTVSGIAEIAYQQELVPVVWMRLTNGGLIGATYKRDTLMTSTGPTFCGAHQHTLGSGRTVSSICVGPSEGGNLDALSLITVDNSNRYHVELMQDMWEEGDTIANGWFLDAAVVPSSYTLGTTAISINGLWSMNNLTVTVTCAGLDCGDWVVNNGSLVVPFFGQPGQNNTLFTAAFANAFPIGQIPLLVGHVYVATGQLLTPQSPQDTGARNGPGFGKKKRFHGYQAQLVDTQGIYFGTNTAPGVAGSLRLAQLKTAGGGSLLPANVLFSGLHKDTLSDDPMGYTNQLAWSIPRPFPAIVAAIGGFIETADE